HARRRAGPEGGRRRLLPPRQGGRAPDREPHRPADPRAHAVVDGRARRRRVPRYPQGLRPGRRGRADHARPAWTPGGVLGRRGVAVPGDAPDMLDELRAAAEALDRGDPEPLAALFAQDAEWRGISHGHLWWRHTPS